MQRRLIVLALVLCATIIGVAAKPKWHQLDGYTFDAYVRDFSRPYQKGTEEYVRRRGIFNRKLHDIRSHNADGTHTWKKGVNQFTDLTAAEFAQLNKAYMTTGVKPTRIHQASAQQTLPETIDYRTWNSPRVLTSIKHQGSCGSCWAFSATESLESYYALLTGMLPVLSTQQITSCTGLGTAGCNGGDYVLSFLYLNTTMYGSTEEWAYPYKNFFFDPQVPGYNETDKCWNVTAHFPNKNPYSWFADLTRVGVNGVVAVTPNDAQATQNALATTGPLSISVAAGNWQDYEHGVYQNTDKNGEHNEWSIDHAVQMVGYGYDGDLGLNYWIVRNSWSTLWGESGYIRLDRPAVEPCSPDNNTCGTSGCLVYPYYPLVKENPPQQF